MTSSLVGSEMCIRDRKQSLPRTASPLWFSTLLHKQLLAINQLCFLTVSYTHLTLPTICSV
eukprot:1196559-Prorocentrum_lima.AAC.1